MPVVPETRFVRSGEVDIAYQVFGDGDIDVLLVPGWISHCELAWELPEFARFLERFAEFSRVIRYDKRGTGLSDRTSSPPTLEQHVDDMRAVMDAAGSERAAIVGWVDGAAAGVLCAATYPERVSALVLNAVVASIRGDADSGPGIDPEVLDHLSATIESNWGDGWFLQILAPSVAGDARFLSWWRRFERSSVTPNAAASFYRFIQELDIRAVLPTLQIPTLVIHRKDAVLVNAAAIRWFAGQIPDARYLELPGTDVLPYAAESEILLDEIEEFLTGTRIDSAADRVLATVLFMDIVGSTPLAESLGDRRWGDLLAGYYQEVRRLLARFRGVEIDTAGDGFVATFDGPARAIRCAIAIQEMAADLGMEVRAGVHTGEVELHGGSISGLAVHIGARIGALAEGGEVLVSATVKDLVCGSGLGFEDRGRRALKGVEGEWQLFNAHATRRAPG